jgi:hypothetical protein
MHIILQKWRLYIDIEAVGLERGPLRLMSTTEGLHEIKSSGFGLEIREDDRKDLSGWPRGTCIRTFALTSPTSGGRSVAIALPRTQASLISFYVLALHLTKLSVVQTTRRPIVEWVMKYLIVSDVDGYGSFLIWGVVLITS